MIYVTSDLHGYPLDSFLRLLESSGFGDSDCLYVLGDVIDRNGDGGVAMLRWMMNRPNVVFLMGNHEDMLLDCEFLFDEVQDDDLSHLSMQHLRLLLHWIRNGADPTIQSLRELRKKDPEELAKLLAYMRNAPLYLSVSTCGRDFLLVHSGFENFSPERELSDYSKDELLWHRPPQDESYFQDTMTILGHTPTGYMFGTAGKMYMTDTWIDIDVGAAGGRPPMILRLDDLKEFYVDGEQI